MRILFVAFPNSTHSARWINQVADQGWELHLVPSVLYPLNPSLRGKIKVHGSSHEDIADAKRLAVKILDRLPYLSKGGPVRRLLERVIRGNTSAQGLERLIKKIKPDIVHSMEIQHAGYLALEAKERMGSGFPTWIVSNWGSDVYLYHRIAAHQERVRQVLANCDYYACECQRDVELAKELGLKGEVLPVIPCAGGFTIEQWHQFRQPGPTSDRRVILLKGYQNWAGRALVGLQAIELCADVLQGYRVVIQLASPDIPLAAELVSHSTGIPIEIVPESKYEDALQRFGTARVHIGLSISDGISQSMLESMVMGAFPIQSCTACANEWIENGKSGFIVPPEDPHIVAEALRRAVTDDDLVDQAVAINDETARQRLAYAQIKGQVIDMYQSALTASRRTVSLHQTTSLA